METRGFTLYPAPNDNHTVYVMWRRFPKTGFYDKPITCVIVSIAIVYPKSISTPKKYIKVFVVKHNLKLHTEFIE